MAWSRHRTSRAFSLLELVIVVVIMAVIGAVAIPRLSRGSDSASFSKLKHDWATLQRALELYQIEHEGAWPDAVRVAPLLLRYSNLAGDSVKASPDATHIYGPYLREIPPLALGPRQGQTGIKITDAPTVGWLYNPLTGTIRPNIPNEGGGQSELGGQTEGGTSTPDGGSGSGAPLN
jgi:general secretion pathway protein G